MKKLPLILIATIAILAGGGVLYLRIKPGPGKKLDVTQPSKETTLGEAASSPISAEGSFTPAEKVVKRTFENYLRYSDIIHRNIKVKEVENDGYEAVVIASAEIRDEDKKWETKYKAITAKLVGESWSTQSAERIGFMFTADWLRAWRDVKVLGLKEVRLIPPGPNCQSLEMGLPKENKEATKTELLLEVENSGDIAHELIVYISARAKNPVEKKGCLDQQMFVAGEQKIYTESDSRKDYSIIGKTSVNRCCMYKDTVIGDEADYGGKNFFIKTIDGYQEPYNEWWLEHPEYIP